MRKRTFLTLVLIAAAMFAAWTWLIRPKGRQKVAYVPASKECHAAGEWRYCIHRAQQGVNGDIAYLLHGRNLDEHIWNDDTYYTALLQQHWEVSGVTPPTVVTVSRGPLWFLTRKSEHPASGQLDALIETVAPVVEARLGAKGDRIVFGESMGGLNALMLALFEPRFASRVAALCPPLYKASPFDSWSDWWAFLARTGADPRIMFGILGVAQTYLDTADQWKAINPIQQIENVNVAELPELYVSNGLYDRYGNFEGVEHFVGRARARGARVEWRPLYGGHCATDIASLAAFLARSQAAR